MNAGELRKLLSEYPDELPVFICSTERGYYELEDIDVTDGDNPLARTEKRIIIGNV
jgi:hypothetical protein